MHLLVENYILGMHLNGPFYEENQLNFKKYESTYLFTSSEIQVIPVRHRCGPIKTFYHWITFYRITQYNDKKQNPQFGNPIQKGPCQKFFHKTNTIYHKTIKKEKLNFENLIQTVGFHLQGLQIAAFV